MKYDYVFVDGKNLLFRMHATHRSLSAKIDGEEQQTGGMYGFLASSARIFRRYQGRVMVAWEDRKGRNWRYKVWPEYKPREPGSFQDVLDQEVETQRERLIEILGALGVRQYRADRCEADDVLARLARVSTDMGKQCVVYSGDSDLLQLVTDKVRVACSSKGKEILYSPKGVLASKGVRPSLIPALKALAGDSSDGIPGAKHVGPVAAATLLNHYGSLEEVLNAAMSSSCHDWPVQERMRESIEELVNNGLMAKFAELTVLRDDCRWKQLPYKVDTKEAYGLLKRYKMHSLAMTAPHWTALNRMGRKQKA